MKMTMTVLGARRFNDTVEGQAYDFTKLRVQMPVPDESGNEVGYTSTDIPFGTSKNFDQLKGLKFPAEYELDIEMTSKGYTCKGFRAIGAAAQHKLAQG